MHIYYHILGVSEGASDEEIRKAYMAKVKEHPPETSPQEFQRLSRSYEGLKDKRARAKSLFEGFSMYRDLDEGLKFLAGERTVKRKLPALRDLLAAEGLK